LLESLAPHLLSSRILQINRDGSTRRTGDIRVGAVLILLSLITAWNLPAAIMEGFWALISIYGAGLGGDFSASDEARRIASNIAKLPTLQEIGDSAMVSRFS
jgi:hypothetical protein